MDVISYVFGVILGVDDYHSITADSVTSMRAQELRNLLIQKFGVSRDTVARILDRNELKDIAIDYVIKDQFANNKKKYLSTSAKVSILILMIIALISSRNYIPIIIRQMKDFIIDNYVKTYKRLQISYKCLRRGHLFACFIFAVASLLELYIAWVNISVLGHWILPKSSFVRFLFAKTISLPLSPQMLTTKTNDLMTGLNNWSIDIGPMISLWISRWLVEKLENYGAGIMLKQKKRKKEK